MAASRNDLEAQARGFADFREREEYLRSRPELEQPAYLDLEQEIEDQKKLRRLKAAQKCAQELRDRQEQVLHAWATGYTLDPTSERLDNFFTYVIAYQELKRGEWVQYEWKRLRSEQRAGQQGQDLVGASNIRELTDNPGNLNPLGQLGPGTSELGQVVAKNVRQLSRFWGLTQDDMNEIFDSDGLSQSSDGSGPLSSEELTEDRQTDFDTADRVEALEAENARLRNLMRHFGIDPDTLQDLPR